jgi:hypothetical protein
MEQHNNQEQVRRPCSHCGAPDPVIYPNEVASCGAEMGMPGVDAFYAHCDGCGADGPIGETMQEALDLWNGRAAIPATPAMQFKLAQMFAVIREFDSTGTLEQYLASNGLTAPACSTENASIEGTELILLLDAYATDGTNGYEFHHNKIVAYIKEKRFGLGDYRVTLANAALALYSLAKEPVSRERDAAFGQSNLATLASAIDDLDRKAPKLVADGLLSAVSAAFRFFSIGRSRPEKSSRFGETHLTVLAGQLEKAITAGVPF